MDDECECTECKQHAKTLEALKKSPLRLIQCLSCKNHRDHPDCQCIFDLCKKPECGVTNINQLFEAQLINIRDTEKIGFKQTINLQAESKKGKKYNYHANIYEEYEWQHFKSIYIEQLREFMIHYNTWIPQHQTRRDFVNLDAGRIPNAAIYCHFDFIQSIHVSVH